MSKKPQCDPGEIRFPDQKIETSYLVHGMEQSYIEYAMSIIVGRALPDVRNGLKPIHRRTLYTMYEDDLTADKPFKKPVTYAGDVLSRYHPHGDASVYDALVRLVQDLSMCYPLVDGHGNFGFIDGDPPAAHRYTEARMAKISDEMLREIEKDTVDWDPNFDESRKKPRVLPSRFPNLLVNGSSGIAVGMATNIPPHNLQEVINAIVCALDNPEAELSDLMEYVKGPDFSTRGIIIDRSGIRAAYATGRGRVYVRAHTEFEEFGNDRTRIIVTKIPYQVSKHMLIKNVADQMGDKRLEGISDIRDESDRNGMWVVVEFKRDANPQVVSNHLFAQTQLQTTFAVNMLALVQPGGQPQPKILSLRHTLDEYVAFQEEVIVRRTRYDLRKAQERAHLLESLLIAEDNIDAAIQTIRENYDDAKENLMNRFGLSNVQAQATLDMQLKRLQGLEKEKLQNEYKELGACITYFNELLSSEGKIRGVLEDELTAIRDRYGDDWVTEIQDVEGEIDIKDLIEEEECVFTLTTGGYIERTVASTYKARRRGGKGIAAVSTKEEDYMDTVFTASIHDFTLFLADKGRVHRKRSYQIPEAGRTVQGTDLVNVLPIEQDEKVTAMIHLREFPEDRCLVMVTRSGTVKRIQLSSIYTAREADIRYITLDEGDELICVWEADGDQTILIVTHDGMAIYLKGTDVCCMGRDAVGVRGINLRPDDYVVGAAWAKRDHQMLMITGDGYNRRTDVDEYIRANGPQKRGGFGLRGYNVTEKTGPVVGVKVVSDEDDVLVINDAGVIICMATTGIPTYGRTAQGVKIMNLEKGVEAISFARTDHEEKEEAAEGEIPTGGLEQA